jgi:hypothetical protein
VLEQSYFDSNIATVEERLQTAGVRLALLLNDLFADLNLNVQPADFITINEGEESCGDAGGNAIFLTNHHPIADIRVKVRRTIATDSTKTRSVFTYVLKPGESQQIACSKMHIHTGAEATCTITLMSASLTD